MKSKKRFDIRSMAKGAIVIAGLATSSMSHAGWMGQFSTQPLNSLVIPGSHDSGSYEVTNYDVTSPDFSEVSLIPDFLQAIFAKSWGQSQSLTIGQQLTAGYRYFDLRLCAEGDAVYTCHGVYMAPLSQIISDVKNYLGTTDAASEVIVLDFNHMYGMTPALHAAVVSMLATQLGQWIAAPGVFSMSTPVGTFASEKKHVIIAYADQATQIANSNMLWPDTTISSPWPDVQTISGLEIALSVHQQSSATVLYVHQAQLTPSSTTVEDGLIPFSGSPSSLRAFTSWYENSVADWIKGAGVVNVASGGVIIQDFVGDKIFSGIDLAQFAIVRNQQLFSSKVVIDPLSSSEPASMPTEEEASILSSIAKSITSFFRGL
jgi:hypothetical protein